MVDEKNFEVICFDTLMDRFLPQDNMFNLFLKWKRVYITKVVYVK